MTVLDLDPPHPALRLVSSDGQAPARDHRYRSGVSLYGDTRSLYRDVLQTSLIWGKPIDPDALRVVLATKQATSAAPARAFSAAGVWQLMFVDVLAWCRNRQLDVPAGCAESLTLVINHLEATNTFDPLSDEFDDLLDAIDECTGGGWSESHPSSPAGTRRSLRSGRGPKRT